MGATLERNVATGRTVEAAFKGLQEALNIDYGTEYYQGHQGTNALNTDKIFKNESEVLRFMEDHNYCKGTSFAYEIQKPIVNKNTIKTTVTRFPNKETRKWETVYVGVVSSYFDKYHHIEIIEAKQVDAIAKARLYVEKNPDVTIKIEIRKRLINNKTLCAKIEYKPSKTERLGRWGFIGYCAC